MVRLHNSIAIVVKQSDCFGRMPAPDTEEKEAPLVRVSPATATFLSHALVVSQSARARDGDGPGIDHTGSMVWPASRAALALLEREARGEGGEGRAPQASSAAEVEGVHVEVWEGAGAASSALSSSSSSLRPPRLLPSSATSSSTTSTSSLPPMPGPVVDLSAGAGLVSAALALAGASVIACDIDSQLPQLRANLLAALDGTSDTPFRVVPHLWGEGLSPLEAAAKELAAPQPSSRRPFSLVVASDVVYIALRDGCTRELRSTLLALALRSELGLLLTWQARREEEELAFVRGLVVGRGEGDSEGEGARGRRTTLHLWRGPAWEEGDGPGGGGEGGGGGGVGHPDAPIFVPCLFEMVPEVWYAVLRVGEG